MALPILTKAGADNSPLTLPKGRFLPASEPRIPNQSIGKAGGGQVKVANLGTTERFWRVKMTGVVKAKRDDIIEFFEHANVNWSLNTFTFTDENSTAFTVRLWNPRNIDFPLGKGGLYSLNLLLRQEIT